MPCAHDDKQTVLQLRAMSETSVLITPCGGTGTVLTFLQPGATAIVMNYWLPSISASMQMESLYYWHAPLVLVLLPCPGAPAQPA